MLCPAVWPCRLRLVHCQATVELRLQAVDYRLPLGFIRRGALPLMFIENRVQQDRGSTQTYLLNASGLTLEEVVSPG